MTMEDLGALATEASDPRYAELDLMSVAELAQTMNEADAMPDSARRPEAGMQSFMSPLHPPVHREDIGIAARCASPGCAKGARIRRSSPLSTVC
ncbi:hypothetical protein [Microbacterium sp. BF1]|uniref:hypothetical protein n=1 Tax=Microbacterium sp. BF1 TaxID=2821146 RepID=UPI002119F0DA|nr:hypothetical protein [Microbacterium sp. BF1]